jgi:ferritin-like metal-binding protein YciE
MSKLREAFLDELADIYDAERQLVKALPKMAEAAENESLKAGFEQHLNETKNHVTRLEQAFELLGKEAKAKKCKAMKGLIAEGEELIDDNAGDAALIAAAQKVEHYEIASYGTLKEWANLLKQTRVAQLFEQTLSEEEATDRKLTEVARVAINPDESATATEEESEEARAE